MVRPVSIQSDYKQSRHRNAHTLKHQHLYMLSDIRLAVISHRLSTITQLTRFPILYQARLAKDFTSLENPHKIQRDIRIISRLR